MGERVLVILNRMGSEVLKFWASEIWVSELFWKTM